MALDLIRRKALDTLIIQFGTNEMAIEPKCAKTKTKKNRYDNEPIQTDFFVVLFSFSCELDDLAIGRWSFLSTFEILCFFSFVAK